MEQTRPFFYKGLISFVKKVGNGNEIPAVKRDKKRRDAEFSAKLLILPKIETMEQQQTDEKFMRLALNEAEKALEEQEVPIGAVVVADAVSSAGGTTWSKLWRTLRPTRKCRP